MTHTNGDVDLNELWGRLESACQKLWQEDKVAAIPLQAVADEVRIAFRHVEQLMGSMKRTVDEQQSLIAHEFQARYDAKVSMLERQLAESQARVKDLEKEQAKSKAHVDALMSDIEVKEKENTEFREKYLKIELQRDSERAKQLESFLEELNVKEREREAHWKQRSATLEDDIKLRQRHLDEEYRRPLEDLQQRAAEMEDSYTKKEVALKELQRQLLTEFQLKDAKLKDTEASLKVQSESLASHAQELDRSYGQKRAELERLKQDMRAEIAELARHYKAK
jgi:chromosome segregation ATPase